ncbi:MAG: hypothetical protein JWP25_4737 [Bradyrhizobium sp.]|jgi:hypothetical protein|nr:hypothetical protein [Bradyrhizobium sp.]
MGTVAGRFCFTFGHFPFAFIFHRLMIGLNVLFLAKCKPNESEHHQDGSGYNQPMRILHRCEPPYFFAVSACSTGLLTLKVEPSVRLSERAAGRAGFTKSIETAQPLILLFQEFAIGDHLCSWRFCFWIWRHDTIVAIEPVFRWLFYSQANLAIYRFPLGINIHTGPLE